MYGKTKRRFEDVFPFGDILCLWSIISYSKAKGKKNPKVILPFRTCFNGKIGLLRGRTLGDLDQIVGTNPLLKGGLHVLGLELQIMPGGDSRLIERQAKID
jgi:hypothetical protein